MNWNSVRRMRWVLAGVGVTAGAVLLYAGATLIGVVLLVMGGLRLAMLTMVERQRRAGGGAGMGRGTVASTGPGGARRELLERLARNELGVAAATIGVSDDELRRAVGDGQTIAAVASDAGVPTDRVIDAVVRDATGKVDTAVAAGNLAPNRATRLRAALPRWATRFVTETPSASVGTPS